MDRLLQKNVIAMSGRAVEASGDVDTLLLDKTGTITHGNRMATELLPLRGVRIEELAAAAQLASLADETPEGRSIVSFVTEKLAGNVGSRSSGSRRRARRHLRPVHRADAHERPRSAGRPHRSARARSTRSPPS